MARVWRPHRDLARLVFVSRTLLGGPGIAFGLGFGIGFYGGFGWGWDTGDMTGITTAFFSITTATYLTAEFSSIEQLQSRRRISWGIRRISWQDFASRRRAKFGSSTGSRSRIPASAIPVLSAALIMEGWRRGFSARGRSSFGGGFHGGGGFQEAEAAVRPLIRFNPTKKKLKIWRKKSCTRTI